MLAHIKDNFKLEYKITETPIIEIGKKKLFLK